MGVAEFLVINALTFLGVAIMCAIVAVIAPNQQGLAEIMYWFTAVSLAAATGFVFAFVGHRDEQL